MVNVFVGGTNKVNITVEDINTALRHSFKSMKSDVGKIQCIIGGLTQGPEVPAREWAEKYKVRFDEHLPHPELGQIMWVARNKTVVAHSDVLLIFWDGKSSGARNLMNAGSKRGKRVYMAQCYKGIWNKTISEWEPPADTDWTSVW
jgi:hypothetical protein